MQPEAVAARLVTTHHRRISGQAQSLLGSLDLRRQCADGAGRNLSNARALPHTPAESQLPGSLTQFEGQQQTRRRCSRLGGTGRGDHHDAPPIVSVTAINRVFSARHSIYTAAMAKTYRPYVPEQ